MDNTENTSFSDLIADFAKYGIDRSISDLPYDQTFRSVITSVGDNDTYVIKDLSGQSRTVKCSIPNITLVSGTIVWVTIPSGKLKDIYISGVA